MTRLAQVPLPFVLAPYSDPDTSRDAAKSIEPHLFRLQTKVLIELNWAWDRYRMGLTAEQIEMQTGLSGNTVRPRLVELRRKGLVVKTDERRATMSGRKAAVWKKA